VDISGRSDTRMEKIALRGALLQELFTILGLSMQLEICHPSGVVYNFEVASRFVENFCIPALSSLGVVCHYLHAVILLESKFTWVYGSKKEL
jgi:hypothetical protein